MHEEDDRFELLDDDVILSLWQNSKNKNTNKSTNTWINAFRKWAEFRGFQENIAEYEPYELNTVLERFYAEVRKKDGTDYEPDSLRVMQASLHRHLVEQNYPKSILSDVEFVNSRRVLEGKAKALREQGKGKKPNKSEPMTIDEENMLWEAGKLGDSSPSSLVHTMWFLNVQHFGQRGQQEHSTMTMENFVRKTDESTGAVYIEFLENPTKTRQGGLRPKQRVTNPKMFEFPSDRARCPVTLFEKYVSKRPAALKNTGRFYLSPRADFRDSGQWYKQVPVGKNKIASFMKSIIKDTSLEHSGKNITNHSGRKMLVKKLKAAGIPESSIIKVTGHTSTKGLSSYDPGDQREFQEMSNALAVSNARCSKDPMQPQQLPSLPCQPSNPSNSGNVFNNCSVTINYSIQQNQRKRKYNFYEGSSSQ